MLQSRPYNHCACLIPPSPTTTNGAHRAGCAFCAGPVSLIAVMACRWASARVRPVLAAASIRVVSATAASESTGQCETTRPRLPALKKAFASTDSPFAPGVPSAAAVLHADRMTQSALSFRCATSLAVRRPYRKVEEAFQHEETAQRIGLQIASPRNHRSDGSKAGHLEMNGESKA